MADSSESMTQSVPSRMALATSVASARVGRRFLAMDSSIWVAVITGLPNRLARAMIRFWRMAISSMGISTPRSPRATMSPSAASSTSSIRSRMEARSTLAMMNGWWPRAAAALRTAWMSAAQLTNDWLTASTPCSRANSMQARSWAVKAEMPRSMPGRLSPFFERRVPPTTTRVCTRSPSTVSTRTWMRPSLMNRTSSGRTTRGSSGRLTETSSRLPTSWRLVRVKRLPTLSSTGSSARVPMRIFGPGRSAMMATGRWVARAASRMRRMISPWARKSPWEKLRRAMFMPASSIFSSMSGESVAGPMVQTSLVLLAGRLAGVYMRTPVRVGAEEVEEAEGGG